MDIQIISLGKFKSTIPYKDIFNFYKNRISLNLNLIELKTYNFEKRKNLTLKKMKLRNI